MSLCLSNRIIANKSEMKRSRVILTHVKLHTGLARLSPGPVFNMVLIFLHYISIYHNRKSLCASGYIQSIGLLAGQIQLGTCNSSSHLETWWWWQWQCKWQQLPLWPGACDGKSSTCYIRPCRNWKCHHHGPLAIATAATPALVRGWQLGW